MDIKTTLAIGLLLLSNAVSANNIIPLPACNVPGPYPVEYHATTQAFLNKHGGAIASAGRHPGTGKYFILYDHQAFNSFPAPFQKWIMAHECAHHQLGHTIKPFEAANREKVNRDERAADCRAAQTLSKMSEKEWKQVFAVMSDKQRLDKFAGYPAHIDPAQFGYHNDHADRVATVKRCRIK
jgi:uncharacterized protein YifE (UPF0438 family)